MSTRDDLAQFFHSLPYPGLAVVPSALILT
jgi:hypothetical protein